jgi:hypothetical protein
MDNVTSATAGDVDRSTPVTTVPRADELAVRAQAWVDIRESLRIRDLEAASAESLDALAADAAAATTTTAATRSTAAKTATTKAPAAKAVTTTKAPVKTTAKAVVLTRPPITVTPSDGDPSPEQWADLRRCESGGNYRALGGDGRFRGAYQFLQSTWNHVARLVYPHLDGLDPIDASPYEQDSMAMALFHMGGASQWPLCGASLR